MNTLDVGNLRVTIVAATGLYKSNYFGFPDPFAIATIDSEQACRTGVIEKTLTPHWNESFIVKVNKESILTIRVFDQKKFQKNEQGFLGVFKVQIGSVVDLNVGGDKSITQDLQMSKSGGLIVHGKLTVNLSANLSFPADRPAQYHASVPSLLPQQSVDTTPAIYPTAISREPHTSQQTSIGPDSIASSNTSTTNVTLLINEGILPSRSTTSEDAILAWNRRFAESQVRLERNDSAPFSTVRRLGAGGIGIVFETKLDGISLALKRTYTRRLTDHHLNEIRILSRISENRHKHIVELIGSYIHRQQSVYELGLLMWPVAHSDLAVFSQDIDSLGQWIQEGSSGDPTTRSEDLDSAVENLSTITGIRQPWGREGAPNEDAIHLYESSLETLRSRFGCIANAVAWLHQQGIRHKDLKPSQILLSLEGLWLTDFGWSKDVSELAQSATSGGDNITLKYQSPERAQRRACGRPEDIFALGCTFIEMAYQLARPMLRSEECSAPWKQKGWFFQANLSQVQDLLKLLKKSLYESGHGFLLTKLIADMMALNPDDRPPIDDVIKRLSPGNYFGECCAPAPKARPPSFSNHQQSQFSLINYNSQRYLGGLTASASTGSLQLSYLPATVPSGSVDTSDFHQSYRQVANDPWHLQNYNTGVDSTLENIPSGYSRETPTNQNHQSANVSQNLDNASGPSLGLNTHTPLASVEGNGNHANSRADYMSNSRNHDYNIDTIPQFQGQSLDQPFSNFNTANQTSPNMFPGLLQNTVLSTDFSGPQRTSSFGPIATTPSNSSWKLVRRITNALDGLERQIDGLVNDDRSGRNLIALGPSPLSNVAKVLKAGKEHVNMTNRS